jgi:hypothetical protein
MEKEIREVISTLRNMIMQTTLPPYKPKLNRELSEARDILIKLLPNYKKDI